MKSSRFFALFLTLAMFLCCLPVSAAEMDWLVPKARSYDGKFADVKGSWCESYVETVCEAGLMEGRTADRFDPNGTLTEAQRLVIGARLHALFYGKTVESAAPGEPWWMPAARYYLAVDGNTTDDPAAFAEFADTPASRLSFALQMVWSTPAESLPAINTVTKIPDFDDSVLFAAGFGGPDTPILDLYQAGILNGVDKWGSFCGDGTLTRGQAAAMLARVIAPSLRLEFELLEFDLCRDVFQLDPKTELMAAGSRTITLDQFSGRLATICQQTRYKPDDCKDLALAAARYDIALELLAAQKGYSTYKIVQPENFFAMIYPGESETSAQWQMDHDSLKSLLIFHYDPDASPAAVVLSFLLPKEMVDDLAATEKTISIATSPAWESLDLNIIQQRLLSSPYRYGNNLAFSALE